MHVETKEISITGKEDCGIVNITEGIGCGQEFKNKKWNSNDYINFDRIEKVKKIVLQIIGEFA